MKKIALIFMMLVLLMPALVLSGELQKRSLGSALTYVGITEKKPNSGPEIDQFLGYIGLKPGNPYCAAFVVYNYHIAANQCHKKDQLPKYGRVALLYSHAKQNPLKYKLISPNSITLGTSTLEPGDISIHSRAGGTATNFNGHTGIVVKQLNNTKFEAVEGNTGGGADQGEGEGIFLKSRNVGKLNGNLGLKGWIRIKE